MTALTEAEVMKALATLAGREAPDPEADAFAASMTRLHFISEAQRSGATWEMIARATGAANGKAAKRDAKLLARRTQRQMLANWTPLDDETEKSGG